VDLRIKDLKPLAPEQVKEIEKTSREGNWMGWKYIPETGGVGSEVSHATLFPTNPSFSQIWTGSGEVHWNHLNWEQNPTQFQIVNALEQLPILEYRSASVLKGSSNLSVISKPVRALK
jgi:hypothetical protein